MTPASMRSVVVLPAPSGPTRPKTSPVAAVKPRRSTASVPAKRLVRPPAATAGSAMGPRGLERDRRVGRHAGLELVPGVLDVDADAVDERHPLRVRLHALRRELGLRRDEGDATRIAPVRVGVGPDQGRLAPADAAEVGLADLGAEPDVIEVGES